VETVVDLGIRGGNIKQQVLQENRVSATVLRIFIRIDLTLPGKADTDPEAMKLTN
jgi:hypothetical protein